MKIAFIIILYKTPQKEVKRLFREIKDLNLKNYEIYFIDNTRDNRGYAAGVNSGIRKALKDNADVFVVANPDIGLGNRVGYFLAAVIEENLVSFFQFAQ